jgi:agmatine deiminase
LPLLKIVANAIVKFEPVNMLVNSKDVSTAKEYLSPSVTIIEAELNDAWLRDIGPTFVHSTVRQGR